MSDVGSGSMAMRRLLPRWVALVAGSMVLAELLRRAGLPASALLGPMICAIVAGVTGQELRFSGPIFPLALGVIGCLIATSLPLSVLASILDRGPVFFAGVLAVVLVSAAAGFALARTGVLPGTTALWGSSPGAATPMTIMSASYGADMRLVAFMQYLRVIFVSGSAAAVTRFFAAAPAMPAPLPAPATGGDADAIAETLLTIAASSFLARKWRIPAGALMVPLVVCAALQDTGLLTIALPGWVRVPAYAALGWGIGLRFTPGIVRHALRASPWVVLSTLLVIAASGAVAWLLVLCGQTDPLSAWLSCSPGGEDTIAIIASTTPGVDMSFVMAMQTVRFVLVLFTGPGLARWLGRWIPSASDPGSHPLFSKDDASRSG
ncbi:AbrB family transcriptional regulator [Gluconacetobacter aggeris]|uniref:AbrB family transcriptional regulator n=1 Tax=Gluconacetobacter aggeris TaxID=1286186 RepID=A0A7W4NZZ6_9PROT|nr:AbrB family transcriptional regulator [Gluconacetobacter aggeris]MBB2169155.1 AbrB family transcriptional regulator [Gluconacetobacter aggeris]